MLDSATTRELVARLREGLAQHGELGRFLLDRIDESVARGIEERQDGPEFEGKRGGTKKQVITRRAADDEETLRIHLRILSAYASELPAIASAADRELHDQFGVESVVLALEPDEARRLNQSRESEVTLAALSNNPLGPDLKSALEQFNSLVAEASREGVSEER